MSISTIVEKQKTGNTLKSRYLQVVLFIRYYEKRAYTVDVGEAVEANRAREADSGREREKKKSSRKKTEHRATWHAQPLYRDELPPDY